MTYNMTINDTETQMLAATADMFAILPSIVLTIGSIVWLTTGAHASKPLPVSLIYVLKLLTSILFITLAGFDQFLAHSDDQPAWQSAVLVFGTICSIAAMEMDRRFGAISSPILILYWLLTTFACWMSLIGQSNTDSWLYLSSWTLSILSTIIFAQFCVAENLPKDRHDGSAECTVGWVSSFTMSWVTKPIFQLSKVRKTRPGGCFLLSDLDEMPKEFRIEEGFDQFEAEFHRQLKTENRTKTGEKEGLLDTADNSARNTLYKTILKTYPAEIAVGAGYNCAWGILRWLTPFFLSKILHVIKSASPGEEYISNWVGIMFCFGYCASTVLLYLLETRQCYHVNILALRVRWKINHLLFKKALTVNLGQQSLTSGQLTNLLSDDTYMFHLIIEQLPESISKLMTVLGSIIYLYFIMDWAALVIPAVFLFVVPTTWFVSKKIKQMRSKIQDKNDKRLKIMNEIVNGIRVLKMYAWETAFMKKVNQNRKEEKVYRRINNNLNTAMTVVYRFTPYLIQLVVFSTYVLFIGPLDSEKVFTATYIFGFLAYNLNDLTQLIPVIAKLQVSNERLMTYLTSPDLPKKHILTGKSTNKTTVEISGDYSWNSQTTTLSGIELKVTRGEFVAIVGPVGCGKSSLISSLLGELQTKNGTISLNGTIGYVPQQAWIQNMTVRDNILFGTDYKEKEYESVIDGCCLRDDINGFVSGDQTEIGEKGINMSGGQKQRLSVARAVYANADIYLLDDPLSALDAHVGREMFDKVLGPNGLLKTKTRILVTHATQYLHEADRIIVMDNGGQILATGSLDYLRGLKSDRIDEIIPTMSGSDEKLNEEKSPDVTKKPTGKSSNGALIEDESLEQTEPSWRAIWKYCKIVGPKWGFLYLMFHIADIGFGVVDSIWLSKWVNATTEYSQTYDNSSCGLNTNVSCTCGYKDSDSCLGDRFYLSIYGTIALGLSIVTLIRALTYAEGFLLGSIKIQESMLYSVLRAPISFFDKTPAGRIIHRFSADLNSVDSGLPSQLTNFVHSLLSMVSIFFVVGRTNLTMLAFAIPIFPVLWVMKKYFIPITRDIVRLTCNAKSPVYSNFGNVISGVAVIRATKSENRFTQIGLDQIGKVLKAEYFYDRAYLWAFFRLGLTGQFFVTGIAVFAIYARNWGLSVVDLSLAVSYSVIIGIWLFSIMDNYARLERRMVNFDRVAEYSQLEAEDDWRKPSDTKNFMTKGQIDFANYGVRYRDDPLILKNLNCSINGGEKVGIVGRTGAGKSTLTNGLFRIIEANQGSISIDNIDISKLGLHDLREKLSIIPQEPVLYSGTIRSNLDPHETRSDEELWTAINDAHIKPYISKLEDKLDHQVAENGSNMSVGERQMICLTRALLKRSKVIVMDEATSAIDHITDSLIQTTIRQAFSDSTILTIAHRINTIIDYDRIMVLDQGQIAEFDTPAKLFENEKSIFRSLCDESQISLQDIQTSKEQ